MALLDWLLDSDPAIRWQVLRDLAGAPTDVVAAERARVATDGWGGRLLALRDADGRWAGGACFPGRPSDVPGQPWTSTLPTLVLLRELGVDPDALRETVALVLAGVCLAVGGDVFGEAEAGSFESAGASVSIGILPLTVTVAGLLVLGSSPSGVLARVFLGSRARKLIRYSPVPVVVLPGHTEV